MAANAKTLKRRIKSVANTRKITKAMEMVAASKMRKAVSSVLGTRPYAELAWNTISAVSRAVDGEISHPLLEKNEKATKSLVIVYTSDRGLAGAFNGNIIKLLTKKLKDIGEVDAIAVGKRGIAALNRADIPVIASFEDLTNKPTFNDVLPIGKLVLDEYGKGTYKSVIIVYTNFISALSQNPVTLELLPLGTPESMEGLGEVKKGGEEAIETRMVKPEDQKKGGRSVSMDEVEYLLDKKKDVKNQDYTFEPGPQAVLDKILPRLVETMIYQALLESAASEHSARMMAMKNATDAAGDMLSDLKFTYNQIRQAGITQEIAEISSGAAAVE